MLETVIRRRITPPNEGPFIGPGPRPPSRLETAIRNVMLGLSANFGTARFKDRAEWGEETHPGTAKTGRLIGAAAAGVGVAGLAGRVARGAKAGMAVRQAVAGGAHGGLEAVGEGAGPAGTGMAIVLGGAPIKELGDLARFEKAASKNLSVSPYGGGQHLRAEDPYVWRDLSSYAGPEEMANAAANPNVTDPIIKALGSYSDGAPINRALRSGKELNEAEKELVHYLDEAMDPMPENLVLFRGDANVPKDWVPKKGETLYEAGYTSTSADPDLALNFASPGGRPMFRIHGAQRGTKIDSEYAEDEILLERGTKFVVLRDGVHDLPLDNPLGRYTVVDVAVVPKENPRPLRTGKPEPVKMLKQQREHLKKLYGAANDQQLDEIHESVYKGPTPRALSPTEWEAKYGPSPKPKPLPPGLIEALNKPWD